MTNKIMIQQIPTNFLIRNKEDIIHIKKRIDTEFGIIIIYNHSYFDRFTQVSYLDSFLSSGYEYCYQIPEQKIEETDLANKKSIAQLEKKEFTIKPSITTVKVSKCQWIDLNNNLMGNVEGCGSCYIAIPKQLPSFCNEYFLTLSLLDSKHNYLTIEHSDKSYKIKAFIDQDFTKATDKAVEYFVTNDLDIANLDNWKV